MRTTWMMMTMLSVWALPVQAEHNEERPAAQNRDASPVVLAMQVSKVDRAGVRYHAPVHGTREEGRPALRKLGPAPRVHLTAEQIAEAVRGTEAGASGDVLIVDCNGNFDHDTIQGAIDAASDGDVIIVLPNTCTEDGHYFENINFLGKAITVQSIVPTDVNVVNATIINGSLLDRVVTFDNGEGQDSVLDGLTITNGTVGVRCLFASPTIRGCHITANEGGMSLGASSPRVLNCRITNNVTTNGGGVRAANPSSNPTFISCVIAGNAASSDGGGLVLGGSNGLTLRNCTIANNSAGARGGGILFISDAAASWTLSNNILWGNSAPQGPAVDIESISPTGSVLQLTVAYSNIEGGMSSIAGEGQLIWAAGNFVADPLFADADMGGYHLAANSPCIDAGDPETTLDPQETDFDGEPRLQHCGIDTGADETPLLLDCNGNGLPDSCEIQDGTTPDDNDNQRPDECEGEIYADCNNCPGPGNGTQEDPFCSIQEAIFSAFAGDTVVVAPSVYCTDGAYFENINYFGRSITVRSVDPGDPQVVADTVIDGSTGEATVATFQHGESPDAMLDGLTLTGGIGTVVDLRDDGLDAPIETGGGIRCHNSSPTIRHCRIVNNQATEGGGIAIRDGHPTITQCHISNNLVQVASFPGFFWLPEGGGVALSRGSALLDQCHIEDNLIDVSLNGLPSWGNGAGISVITGDVDSPQLLMQLHNCVVGGNEISDSGPGPGPGLSSLGGGLMAFGYSPDPANIELDIRNSIFVDNRAPYGAGLYLASDTTAYIQGTTITGNYWDETSGNGLGGQFSSATIVNSLIYGNAPFDVTADYGVDYVFEYSNIGVTEDVEVEGPGNINEDPLFVDPDNGDYHLTADSPCVDAGDPEFVPEEEETDIDGDPRVVGGRVDMGADEFLITCDGDFDLDGAVGPADLALLLGDWGTCGDPDDCPADLDGDGAVGPFDLALLLGNWGPC